LQSFSKRRYEIDIDIGTNYLGATAWGDARGEEVIRNDHRLASFLASRVKAEARAIGFDAAGICDLRPIERAALEEWLARGYAASMGYMHRQATKRHEPQRIVPGSCRAVVLLKNYFQSSPSQSGDGRVARYAWGEDYHRVLGDMLARLAEKVVALGAQPEHTRGYVDAGPVPERELAQRAGLGWIAKNTMLIHRAIGSFTFIASLFTDLPLLPDEPFQADHCGSCRRCVDACPTEAFPSEWVLDSNRCISYLTIEHRDRFEEEQGRLVGDWLFGCDICQDVCPWNVKFATATAEPRFAVRTELVAPQLDAVLGLDGDEFEATYGDTAFERPGVDGLKRNAEQVTRNRESILHGR
jgi:epoxyqueuosine reductase